jgi:hypothetical protein
MGQRTATAEMALFDVPVYPCGPGAKAGGTSAEAGLQIAARARVLRRKVYETIRILSPDGLTADETAQLLKESVLSVRPRVSELKALGLIVATGERRRNASGMSANVWRAAAVPEPRTERTEDGKDLGNDAGMEAVAG